MLEELLRHNSFGNKQELTFFLFDGLSTDDSQALNIVNKYCTSNLFSIARSFDGIVSLLKFLSFIDIIDDDIILNKTSFDRSIFNRQSYFQQFHFYERLIFALKKEQIIQHIFNEDNIKFNIDISQYYILENRLPYKYYAFRNMLLSTGFFYRNEEYPNHLVVTDGFTSYFNRDVVQSVVMKKYTGRKVSLSQLKIILQNREAAGRSAEIFVLEYELKRLKGHPHIDEIAIVSDEYTNAGYDIETFENIDSIVVDRFVEVKSYDKDVSFYWSRNEVEKARCLGKRYFLYLVDRSRIMERDYQPQKFQDPYKKVFENDVWRKEVQNWKILFDNDFQANTLNQLD